MSCHVTRPASRGTVGFWIRSVSVCVCFAQLWNRAGWLAGRGGLDSDGAPVLGCKADGLDTIVLSGRMTA